MNLLKTYACGHIHNFQHIRMPNDNIDYVVNSSASLARPVKQTDGTVFCSSADGCRHDYLERQRHKEQRGRTAQSAVKELQAER